MIVDTNPKQGTLLSILGGSDKPFVSGEEKFAKANEHYLRARYFDAKILAKENAEEDGHPLAWVLRLDLDIRRFAKLNPANKSLCERKVEAEIEDIKLLAYAGADVSKVAQYYLALCYQNKWGVEKQDLGKAAELFTLSAGQGYARAQNDLGVYYKYGGGVKEDEKIAAQLFKLSADQGDAWAQCNLGDCYMHGKGVVKDEVEAARQFELSANQGNEKALFALANCYLTLKGVERDDDKRAYLFLRGENAKHLSKLASDDWESNVHPSAVPRKEQLILLRKLVTYEKPETIYSYAIKYAEGKEVEKDEKFAKYLFEVAASGGHKEAQKAFAALNEAAIGGHGEAQKNFWTA